MLKKEFLFIIICLLLLTVGGCRRQESGTPAGLQVVTTLFPLFDFARSIGGDKARVTMLLPPATEPHTFEPRPEDLVRISRAGLFVYTNPYMEPWAEKVVRSIDSKSLRIVDAGRAVSYLPAAVQKDEHHESGRHAAHDRQNVDPHIWLDFANAALMVDAILDGFLAADPSSAAVYRHNAEELKKRLAELDQRYRLALASCGTRKLLHGGHYTFGYLSRRYGLDYHALSGVSSDAEPSASQMVGLVKQIRSSGARFLFAEELLSPRLTETLAHETGVGVLMLHGAHNLLRDDMNRGVTFFDLMERNLENLRKGLQCNAR